MSTHKIESTEEWEPYLAEIRRLYLDEGQSMKSIQKHLETEYHVRATYVSSNLRHHVGILEIQRLNRFVSSVDQLKKLARRQNWRKNLALKDDEWSQLSTAVEKRKRDGKETEVLVDGKVADAKKLKRSIKRHQGGGDNVEAPSGTITLHP